MRHIIAAILIALGSPAIAADQGYFNCLKLSPEQMAWFTQAGISSCCSFADGMPTRYEVRDDGIYVPPFTEAIVDARACRASTDIGQYGPDRSHWVRVPDKAAAVLALKPNKVGVAIVWWSNASWSDSPGVQHDILCFIRDLET